MYRRYSGGQVFFEFITIIAVLLFVTASFSVLVRDRLVETKRLEDTSKMESVAALVKSEIEIAYSSEIGYSRNFELPAYLGIENYTVELESGYVVVTIGDNEIVRGVQNVTGMIQKGNNFIRNLNGTVMLN